MKYHNNGGRMPRGRQIFVCPTASYVGGGATGGCGQGLNEPRFGITFFNL